MIEAPALHLPFEKLETDVPWVPERHIEITPPEEVVLLEEWGPGAAGPTALSPVAITVTLPRRVVVDSSPSRSALPLMQ